MHKELLLAARSGKLEERLAAIDKLARINDPLVTPVLLECLLEDDWAVQTHAARSLGDTADPLAIPFLVEALHGEDYWVAAEAATALGKIGLEESTLPLIQTLTWSVSTHPTPPPFSQIWAEALRTCQICVLRKSAAWALGQIADERTVPALASVLDDDRPTTPYRAVAWALQQIGTAQALAAYVVWKHKNQNEKRAG